MRIGLYSRSICRILQKRSTSPYYHRGLCYGLVSLAALRSALAYSTIETIKNTKNIVGLSDSLVASRHGANPSTNRFHCPIVYHERYSFNNWPDRHTFPMDKFKCIAECLTTKQLHLSRPLVREYSDFFRPVDVQDFKKVRDWFVEPTGPLCASFFDRFVSGRLTEDECRLVGFREQTSRPELIERTVLENVGTILACQLAAQCGVAANVAGGTHHASRDRGAGYTILNDLAVAANFISSPVLSPVLSQMIQKVLVVDCDVHQGDGTAKFGEHHDNGMLASRMHTLSIHCTDNYPYPKARSKYDIGLPRGTSDDEYLKYLRKSVSKALDEIKPNLVLYDAGVDVYKDDKLGRLHLSEEGIRKRDRWVVEKCVSLGIPIVGVVGGGYDQDLVALAKRHSILHEECSYVWRKYKMWTRCT